MKVEYVTLEGEKEVQIFGLKSHQIIFVNQQL
jgi:hypothetical protein